LTLNYNVSDGTANSAASLNLTLNAVNDPAVIGGTKTGTVTEATPANTGAPTASGTLTATDVDNPNGTFQAVTTATASANGYGTFTMTAGGTWTFVLDNNNAAVNALNTGSSLSDSFVVSSADGTTQVVNITIDGATDAVDVLKPTDIKFSLAKSTADLTGTNLTGEKLGSLKAVDTDSTAWTYSLSGTHASLFTLSGAGPLSSVDLAFASNLAPGKYSIVVTAKDGAGNTYGETYNITVGTGGEDSGAFFSISTGTDISLGLNGKDTITGSDGDDALVGGQNVDILNGQLGNDQLLGGQGDDTFIFDTVLNGNNNVDLILDFDAGNLGGGGADKIQLDDDIFTAFSNRSSLTDLQFVSNATGTAAGLGAQIIFNTQSGALVYDSNGTQEGGATQFAIIDLAGLGSTKLDSSDFIIVA
jgi:VCBS repeat-containing protein